MERLALFIMLGAGWSSLTSFVSRSSPMKGMQLRYIRICGMFMICTKCLALGSDGVCTRYSPEQARRLALATN